MRFHGRLVDPVTSTVPSDLRRRLLGWLALIVLAGGPLAASPASAQILADVEEPVATLDRTSVAAAGRDRAVLTVERFGRYGISVRSEQGVALQLVGRMAGPRIPRGRPGSEDGRLDVFLDRGDYLIRTSGHPEATGQATLSVRAFEEAHSSPAPRLVDLKPVASRLGDFEQRSYWLWVEERRWIQLEAAGRALRDLRLWQDGSWLVDAEPAREVVSPRAGRPLAICRLSARLEPGLYLLTAYGGRPEPWAEDDGEQPFYLRMGLPTLGTTGRARFEVSPFGIDRWRVPARADYFRLELPESRLAVLRVGRYSESAPFADDGRAARIEKTSELPVAEMLDGASSTGYDVVSVQAEAGQPYVLQHFESRHRTSLSGSGVYWLSTVHSGHPGDSVEATAFLAQWDRHGELEPRPLREQTVAVGPRTGWASRANLIEPLSVHVRVETTGTYVVEASGVEARFVFEPFLVESPEGYRTPAARAAGEKWDLEAGYYELIVTPVEKGILEMSIRPAGLLDSLLGLVGLDAAPEIEPVRGVIRFPRVELRQGHRYQLFLNRQPEVRAGVVLRQLPLRLEDPLPLTLRPGEEVALPFQASEPALLRAVAEDGSRLAISLDHGPWREEQEVGPGAHVATARLDGETTLGASVSATPRRLLATTPLPRLPEGTLAALPDFPALTAEEPLHLSLERERDRVFLVQSKEDALYRLETSGLLDTVGRVRSRVVTELAGSEGGGSGRNFSLHRYLGAGDYQLVLKARGLSRGDLGLSLVRSDPSGGGELAEGLPARIQLAAGEAVVYTFRIAETGRHRLRSFALSRTPRCRLEDGDGWPIVPPGGPADFDRVFEAGTYRLLLLPEPVPGRRLTLLEEVVEPAPLAGHGPHRLPLDASLRHRWLEPEGEGPREPDVWLLDLLGPSPVSIQLSGEMQGRLVRRGDGHEVAFVPPLRGYTGELAAGAYRLEVECSRRNNRVDYGIKVAPEALLVGGERRLIAPGALPVSIGEDGLVEISSFGTADVRARLEDENGRTVLRGDDRPGDWNFQLAGHLAAGFYTLHVDPVGATSAETVVEMAIRDAAAVPVPDRSVRRTAERPVIQPGAGAGLQLSVVAGQPIEVDLARAPGLDGPVLVFVRSEIVQPAVRLISEDSGPGWDLSAIAVARRAAAAVALEGPPAVARVWLAGGEVPAADVRLTTLAFEPPAKWEALTPGRSDGELAAGSRVFELPPGELKVRWVATPGLVAVIQQDGQVESVHWNDGQDLSETWVTRGDHLWVLATEPAGGRYTIEILPADGGAGRLAAGDPFETWAPTSGRRRLRVEAGGAEDRTIFVHGAESAVFQSEGGGVLRGSEVQVGEAGGLLTVTHDPGQLAVWVGSSQRRESSLWDGVELPAAAALELPARWRLRGTSEAFGLDHPRPVLLSWISTGAAVYRWTRGAISHSWISTGGETHHAFLPGGRGELAVRGFGGFPLSGALEVIGTPVRQIGEGLGPEVLLGPGDVEAFRFSVTRQGHVGVGVRADSDGVDCELLTESGRRLGRGVVQMHELEPGGYLVVVRRTQGSSAVRARPAVVGVDRPPSGPPEDEIRRYLALARVGATSSG